MDPERLPIPMNEDPFPTPPVEPRELAPGTDAAFATTRWTWVSGAQAEDAEVSSRALEALCRVYWRPVYAFVRRRGHASHEAQDLTQEFFSRLLAGQGFQRVDPDRGRLRSFLLAALKHFLANEWDRSQALKRGGGRELVSLDAAEIGEEPIDPVSDGLSPDRVFDRQWALSVLDQVMSRLERESDHAGRKETFDALKGTLCTPRGDVTYAVIARQLGRSEGAVKVLVHRLRQRYRELLRLEIAATLEESPPTLEELAPAFPQLEIQELIGHGC
jgi:RNA polymerase sigma factor (sigma-70 family)